MLLELNILTFRLPQGPRGKESACHSRRNTRHSFHPWVRKIPWRRKQQPTLVFLPGKSHGHGVTKSWTWLSMQICRCTHTQFLHVEIIFWLIFKRIYVDKLITNILCLTIKGCSLFLLYLLVILMICLRLSKNCINKTILFSFISFPDCFYKQWKATPFLFYIF